MQAVVDAVAEATPGVAWSICVIDDRGRELAAFEPERVLRTASVGKVLLLTELAAQFEAGTTAEDTLLSVREVAPVGGSGLLQYLRVPRLSVHDLAVLVAAVSDNYATNVLLEHVGLDRVKARAEALGLTATALHDRVRDGRGPGMPATLSTGSGVELAGLMVACAHGQLVSPAVSQRLHEWLGNNADTTMLAAAFDLDPLEHNELGDRVAITALFNKTGTDSGVRADVGWVQAMGVDADGGESVGAESGSAPARGNVADAGRGAGYAAIADWDEHSGDHTATVLAGMRTLGEALRAQLEGRGPTVV